MKAYTPSTQSLVDEYRSLPQGDRRRTAIHKILTQRFGADEAYLMVKQP